MGLALDFTDNSTNRISIAQLLTGLLYFRGRRRYNDINMYSLCNRRFIDQSLKFPLVCWSSSLQSQTVKWATTGMLATRGSSVSFK